MERTTAVNAKTQSPIVEVERLIKDEEQRKQRFKVLMDQFDVAYSSESDPFNHAALTSEDKHQAEQDLEKFLTGMNEMSFFLERPSQHSMSLPAISGLTPEGETSKKKYKRPVNMRGLNI